jgi:hypothetical protein
MQKVLASVDTSHVVGLRDQVFLATLAYTFARIGAVVNLKVPGLLPGPSTADQLVDSLRAFNVSATTVSCANFS